MNEPRFEEVPDALLTPDQRRQVHAIRREMAAKKPADTDGLPPSPSDDRNER